MDVTGDKLARATELMKLLSLEKSMKGAIKLVTALKLPNLAEKFSNILEVSLLLQILTKYYRVHKGYQVTVIFTVRYLCALNRKGY